MAVDRSIIGKPTSAVRATVERGPVAKFAAALGNDDPVYSNADAARAAGCGNVPAPPTFTFALPYWATAAEDQPPDPTDGENPMHAVMGELFGQGALVLHGEQGFTYHRPVEVGMVLDGRGVVRDVYEKETDAATMTFVVVETEWTEAATGDPVVTETFNLIARLPK